MNDPNLKDFIDDVSVLLREVKALMSQAPDRTKILTMITLTRKAGLRLEEAIENVSAWYEYVDDSVRPHGSLDSKGRP